MHLTIFCLRHSFALNAKKILSAKKIIKVLEKDGFEVIRQKGSHISLFKRSGDKTYLVVVSES